MYSVVWKGQMVEGTTKSNFLKQFSSKGYEKRWLKGLLAWGEMTTEILFQRSSQYMLYTVRYFNTCIVSLGVSTTIHNLNIYGSLIRRCMKKCQVCFLRKDHSNTIKYSVTCKEDKLEPTQQTQIPYNGSSARMNAAELIFSRTE